MPSRLLAVAATVVTVAALGSATIAGAASPQNTARGEPSGALAWRACGGGFECATLTVPLDHAVPDGPTLDLAVIRAPARDPDQRIGALVVNPGGPGGSGVEFVRDTLQSWPGTLRDRFDMVGFDPRGSGASEPVDCEHDMAAYYALDFSPDDEAERTELVAGVQQLVDACVAAEGERLRHLGSLDTARDLDRLRGALGDERLTYVGFSYGTYIGAQYAAMFPERVRALVLDGAVDPSLDAASLSVDQSAGFEGVLDAFLRWCARADGCGFHRNGQTARAFDALRARIDGSGLAVPGSRSVRVLSATEFDLGLAAILYEGSAGFRFLGEALDAADRGDGTAMADLSDSYTGRRPDGTYEGIEQAFLAISCRDGPPVRGPAEVRAIEEAAAAVAPRTGPVIVNNSLACALWPYPGPEPAPVRAPGAPPVLVVGTRKDPATPFAWAESLARQMESGVLVSAPGSHHTAFARGNGCVDDAVVDYLVEQAVPEQTLVCRRR